MDWKRFSQPKRLVAAAMFLAVVVIGIIAVACMAGGPDAQGDALIAPDIGGPFSLTDQTGQPVHDTKWRGKVLLIYFGYTYCPDVCPTTLQKMTTALNKLPQTDQDQIQPLFITLDPERDTPPVLAEYTPLFDRRIIGLTGSVESIESVARSYKVFYEKVPGKTADDYTIDHSSAIYVMDKDGRYLDMLSDQWSPEEMVARLSADLHKS